uniref:Unplaced genomic scaffold supercont1.2, whole genome shotgun sequence n=1 Tax=Cryptococcus bacillisporus CA1280 TaxID=1296109 RepID=A0A0D0UP84_CRYGA|nr:hypothetical protein I312_01057 [Cryptococcus bacillisporus CA1280]
MSVTSAHSQNSISPSGVLSAPGAHSAQPETEAAGGDLRVRFARACDRCRHRKIKCDNEHPCGKCAAAGVTCTSGMSRPTGVGRQRASRTSFSDMRNNHEAPTEKERTPSSREQRPINKGRKRGRDSEETDKTGSHSNSKTTNVLDHLDTAHFFLSQEGMPRFAGSTSGLPILEATRRLLQTKPDSFDDEQSPMGEPNWSWLSSLLEDGEGSSKNDRESLLRRQERDEPEYFPGRDHASEQGREDIFARISEIIPPDLMASLVQTYFAVVHPVWPIIHIQSFFADFYKWTSYSFAALVVSMCMLATRYTNDQRVLAEPGNCVHKRRQRIILHRVFSQRRQLGFSMVDYIGMDLLVHEKETSADLFIKRNLRHGAWRFAGEGNANSGFQGILVVLGTNKR